MALVFKSVKCEACGGTHDLCRPQYESGITPIGNLEFTCPARGERVAFTSSESRGSEATDCPKGSLILSERIP